MAVVNMHEAKTNLSKLVERAIAGEEIVLARAGKPLVRLVAVAPERKRRAPGIWKGKVWMAEDFDVLPQDVLDAFEGRNE